MTKKPLLQEFLMGDLLLKNKIVMAPLTRGRANNSKNIPTPIIAEYYKQRATAGLIISEGSQVSKRGVGYENTPGIYSKEQTEAWKLITKTVHDQGGKIFIQLWHVGRLSHPDLIQGRLPFAPSALEFEYSARTANGATPAPIPHEMTIEEIKDVVGEFTDAAKNAMEAGFDGVEIHASNGYLIHQFIAPCSNVRTDNYGGSNENRSRFLLEIIEAMKMVMPENKIGVRLNPSYHKDHAMLLTEDTIATFDYLANKLNDFNLAYVHFSEPTKRDLKSPFAEAQISKRYRKIYKGTLMINRGFTFDSGNKVIEDGEADLVAYGVPFISNPDLVYRFENAVPLAEADRSTYYSTGAKGFTDYPDFKAYT